MKKQLYGITFRDKARGHNRYVIIEATDLLDLAETFYTKYARDSIIIEVILLEN